MTRSLRTALSLLAILGCASAASQAEAQCPPYVRFCTTVGYGGPVVVPTARGAQVVITLGAPPPPPVVYVRPAPPPPVYYVQPTPPPQVVYVRPNPMPPQYQYPYPYQYGYAQPGPRPMNGRRNVSGTTGLHFFLAGAGGGGNVHMGGVGGAIRFRPREHYAIDLGVGVFGGTDYYGHNRAEIPINADFLAFLNPQHRLQFYVLGGVGASFAYSETTPGTSHRSYTYVGAETGAGIELRITRGFALNADFRGFLRRQPNGSPEFVNPTTGQTTRVSGGFIGQIGTTFYF